jgi:uncharacterized RDD family membrane protein YckC
MGHCGGMNPDSPSPIPAEYPPAGWYPDPSGQMGYRWWDGQSWSEHASDAVASASDQSNRILLGGQQFVLAGWWRRAGGLLLDYVVIFVPTLLVEMAISEIMYSKLGAFGVPGNNPTAGHTARILVNLFALAVGIIYAVWLIGARGQTVGMMASRVRAVDQNDGTRLTMAQAWRRVLALFVLTQLWTQASFFSGLGHHGTTHVGPLQGVFVFVDVVGTLLTFMWPLGSSLNQTLQDRFAKSVVVVDQPSHRI